MWIRRNFPQSNHSISVSTSWLESVSDVKYIPYLHNQWKHKKKKKQNEDVREAMVRENENSFENLAIMIMNEWNVAVCGHCHNKLL